MMTRSTRPSAAPVLGILGWQEGHDDTLKQLEALPGNVAHPDIGAIVLECTDLPPFSAAIRRATGLPVFDIVTMTTWVVDSIVGDRWLRSA